MGVAARGFRFWEVSQGRNYVHRKDEAFARVGMKHVLVIWGANIPETLQRSGAVCPCFGS